MYETGELILVRSAQRGTDNRAWPQILIDGFEKEGKEKKTPEFWRKPRSMRHEAVRSRYNAQLLKGNLGLAELLSLRLLRQDVGVSQVR